MQLPVEPYSQTLWILLLALVMQITTTIAAAAQFRHIKGFTLLWAIWIFAMLLMVNERASMLELTFVSGIYDFTDATRKAAISLLLLVFTLFGVSLLRECRHSAESPPGQFAATEQTDNVKVSNIPGEQP